LDGPHDLLITEINDKETVCFNIEEFEEYKVSKIFTYHLIKATDAKATEIGEEVK